MISIKTSRTIFRNNKLGERQLKEALSNLLISCSFSPSTIWLVSPWISDFDLLDNRSGDWDSLNPSWGARPVLFSEVLIFLLECGCKLKIVINDAKMNKAFENRLKQKLSGHEHLKTMISESLHTKGLLGPGFFLAGSMNFTYSGASINQEQVTLQLDEDNILEAKLEFEGEYKDVLDV